MERKLKKEREAEGEMFAGKDAFVTAAYKQRLAEMRAAEEAERLREDIDGMSQTIHACPVSPLLTSPML